MRLINPTPDTVYSPDGGWHFEPGEERDVDIELADDQAPPGPLERATADARKRAKQYRPSEPAPAAADTPEATE